MHNLKKNSLIILKDQKIFEAIDKIIKSQKKIYLLLIKKINF